MQLPTLFFPLQLYSLHYVPKYNRYEKRHKNLAAHCSPAFRVEAGDIVTVGQCRPLTKVRQSRSYTLNLFRSDVLLLVSSVFIRPSDSTFSESLSASQPHQSSSRSSRCHFICLHWSHHVGTQPSYAVYFQAFHLQTSLLVHQHAKLTFFAMQS